MTTDLKQTTVRFTGTTPLVLNNIALADPEYGPTKARNEILAIPSRNRTEAHQAQLEYLEWFGGLYRDNGKIVVPTFNISRTLQRAGSAFRLGTKVAGAVNFAAQYVPVSYNGPTDPEELYADEKFRFRKMVNKTPTGAKASMVVCTRPQFPDWSIDFDVSVLLTVLDLSDFEKVLSVAGTTQGLGNARRLGAGRFTWKYTD